MFTIMKKFLICLKGTFCNFSKIIINRIKEFFSDVSWKEVILKACIIGAVFFFAGVDLYAQSSNGGFSTATSTIKGYKDDVANLMKAIGAVIAIVGAFTVYYKMQNGDQDVKKTIMLVLGGCIAFVALGEALPAFFE